MAEVSEASGAFTRAVDAERLRSAQMLNRIRAGAAIVCTISDGTLALFGVALSRRMLPVRIGWLVVAIAVLLAGRASERLLRASWIALIVFDLPMSILSVLLLRALPW